MKNNMDLTEETLDEKQIFKGKVLDFRIQNVKLPNGNTCTREIIKHPGAVGILAFKDEETIILVEQFRKPLEKMLIEIPAGKLEKGETPLKAAIRELEEETSYKAEKFIYLGKIFTAPGFCDECIHLFKAEGLYKGNDGLCDDDEFIKLKEVKLSEVKNMIKSGIIEDSKTICAVLHNCI